MTVQRQAEKDYYDAVPMMDMGRKVDQATAQYNVLGATGTEACANCLFFISPNCCTVVQDWPVPISPTGHSRYWTAVPPMEPDAVRVVIVQDDEGDEGDGGMDMGKSIKAVWSAAMVNDLPDSSFAVISSGGTKDEAGKTTPRSLRHLPYKDASGKVDAAHLRNALSRLPQTTLTASERATAQRKLDAAAKQEGIGSEDSGKGLIDRIVAAVKSAVLGSGGPAGTEGTNTPSGERSGSFLAPDGGAFRLYKSVDDDAWRWIALVSNKYRDRDNKAAGPEIIEEAAHKEYVGYLDQTGDYPEAWLWHTPGTRWGRADWADYADGFLVMSGTVDKGLEDVAAALEGETLGVSHGFVQRYSDAQKGIIGWYRTFEVSALPPEAAANPWTALSVVQKEASMAISAGKRAFLESKLGKERVTALEGDVAALGKALQEAGVEYKELLEADGGAAGASLTVKDIADALAPTVNAIAALTETVTATKASADTATAALDGIETRLKALERSDDEKIAAQFTSRASGIRGFQASKEGGVAKDADDLPDAKPVVPEAQEAWLKAALL